MRLSHFLYSTVLTSAYHLGADPTYRSNQYLRPRGTGFAPMIHIPDFKEECMQRSHRFTDTIAEFARWCMSDTHYAQFCSARAQQIGNHAPMNEAVQAPFFSCPPRHRCKTVVKGTNKAIKDKMPWVTWPTGVPNHFEWDIQCIFDNDSKDKNEDDHTHEDTSDGGSRQPLIAREQVQVRKGKGKGSKGSRLASRLLAKVFVRKSHFDQDAEDVVGGIDTFIAADDHGPVFAGQRTFIGKDIVDGKEFQFEYNLSQYKALGVEVVTTFERHRYPMTVTTQFVQQS